ncbi:replication initiation protein [Hymenobacter lapidiphilus]|uniref:Replication initiation protein n=1 Tax=Hymenobacter lapidiphilus TaxID=2608003 RepID=A0A7Y7PSA1_9BACT|nr:replication initiation protein [Hymenobacter lapidiphilus]NVO33101.1 replication initiation protein [Hymenobacter lapidiphilus]
MPRHPLRRPAARRATAPPRVLPTTWLPDLTTARFAYTGLQLDLLFYLLSILEEATAARSVELWLSGFSAAAGKKHNYSYVAAAAAELVAQPLTIRGKQDQYQPLRLFDRIRSVPGQGLLQIKLVRTGIPYLLELRGLIPATSLRAFLQLPSKHTKRIYALCCRYKAKGRTPTFTVTDFKQMLGLIDEQGHEKQQGFTSFRKHVLEAAIEQINATTDLRIACQMEKHGRTVFYLTFMIKPQALPVLLPIAGTDA